jgi:hypothetical protein
MWLAGWLFIHHLSSWYYWICRDPIDNRDRRHAPFFGISVSDKQLEHLQQCSVRDPAQYKWMKKIQRMPVWLRKIVLAQHNCAGYYHGWYEAQQRCAPEKKRKKSAINVIWLLLSVSDWPRSFVISIVPHLFAIPVFSFIGGVIKDYITELGCEKYLLRVTYWAPLEDVVGFFCIIYCKGRKFLPLTPH